MRAGPVRVYSAGPSSRPLGPLTGRKKLFECSLAQSVISGGETHVCQPSEGNENIARRSTRELVIPATNAPMPHTTSCLILTIHVQQLSSRIHITLASNNHQTRSAQEALGHHYVSPHLLTLMLPVPSVLQALLPSLSLPPLPHGISSSRTKRLLFAS